MDQSRNVRLACCRLCLLWVSGAGIFGAATLHAQQQPAAAQQSTVETVVITGSYIRRTEQETSSPLQVVSAEELHQSGYTSTQQVLNDLTANGQGTLSQSFSGAFATGASGIALRGLNVGATLVLIDGHRSAPYPIGDDGYRSFVDVANLPFEAIERIDVLKDGASAIYGSDAVAGVVNIILKRSYQGMEVTADGGVSAHADGW
ncbi:MAG TPA: TonB-dependent receptor plug domain-containing protein, partial [Steroidobacteraceae bacterium]